MGLFSSLVSVGVDALVVTTGLATVRRFSGFSVHRVANLIKNDSVRKATVVYLNTGELIFDKSAELLKTALSDVPKELPSSELPQKSSKQNKSKDEHSIKVE